METTKVKGLLSVEVKSPPIVAGTIATVSLIVRNPFSEKVVIESIQAPSSAPLLPSQAVRLADSAGERNVERSLIQRLLTGFSNFRVAEISFGSLTAEFPAPRGSNFHINMEPKSKLTFKTPFKPNDNVHINNAEGAEVVFDNPNVEMDGISEEREIPPHQEDLASFELQTAHWLFVKPKVLDLYALIKFRVGDEPRSQVVPVTVSVQPPVKSIVLGAVSGGILGWLARQLNNGILSPDFSVAASVVSALGIIVMAMILAIVLSRQESTKGFVTLEDFYGAFVVGAILGYTGTEYFETSLKSVAGN
ncbi:hypothetical protein ACF8GB_20365 [Pseudomonas sp. xss_4]|uniref:hypothetical protein n=1 Tax=Pseudomonas sp. xss_4 TaxID=3367216 RepID=UPI00370CD40E